MTQENTSIMKKEDTAVQPGFLDAAVSIDEAVHAFELYEKAKARLLTDADILYIGPNGLPAKKTSPGATPYIKKSGWRKMARFFGLSVNVLHREKIWVEDSKGPYYIWTYLVTVSHPCGASVTSEGVCTSRDKFFTKGGKVQADEANVMLKAQTVAINRGISDLLGSGDVSAEEVETSMEGGADDAPAPSRNTKPPAKSEPVPTADNIHELPEGKALVVTQVPAKDDPAWDELGSNEYEVETMDKSGTHYRINQHNVWCTTDGEYVYSDASCFLKPICAPVMIVALIKEFGSELVKTKYPKIKVVT